MSDDIGELLEEIAQDTGRLLGAIDTGDIDELLESIEADYLSFFTNIHESPEVSGCNLYKM